MNGILCIHKPAEFTSFDVIAKVRGILGQRKMGHAGTLDPMATGVLPVFLGGATKAISLMEDHTKQYRASFRLGLTSDTQDIWGNILSQRDVKVCKGDVLSALEKFRGDILQIPPMVSAVHHEGKRLYDLARQGIQVEREPRPIRISLLTLVDGNEKTGEYTVDVACSQGTYIRTLCADIGEALGCGAVMTSLLRTRSCGFTLEECVTIEELQRIRNEGGAFPILPIKRAFRHLPDLTITAAQTNRFRNGGDLDAKRLRGTKGEGDYCVLSPEGVFLGIGRLDGESLKIGKLFITKDE